MPRKSKPMSPLWGDLASTAAAIDATIAASAARDEPAIVPPLAAEAEPAKTAGKPATRAAKQGKAKKPGRSSRKPAARATASRKAASGKAAKPAAKPARKAAKQEKAPAATKTGRKAKAPATAGRKAASGDISPSHATIHRLMQRKNGCNEPEVCEALGWKAAGATISRAVKTAPFSIRKERVDGRTRYFAA
jgi:hypothetical protein